MMREIIVDSFAGGGGASEGIRRALGRSPDVAINHDADVYALSSPVTTRDRGLATDADVAQCEALIREAPLGADHTRCLWDWLHPYRRCADEQYRPARISAAMATACIGYLGWVMARERKAVA